MNTIRNEHYSTSEMPPRFLFPVGPEPHREAVHNGLVRLNEAKTLHNSIEVELEKITRRRSVVGRAWNEMHEVAEESAKRDARIEDGIGKLEGLQRDMSVDVEKHKDMLSRLLAPVPIPKIPAHDSAVLEEIAWKIILEGTGGLAAVQARNPTLLTGVYDESNARLRREIIVLKACIPNGDDVSQNGQVSPPNIHEENHKALLAQYDSARVQIDQQKITIQSQAKLIDCMTKEQSIKQKSLSSMKDALEFSTGRIEGFQTCNAVNLQNIEKLEQKVKGLEYELIKERNEIQRLAAVASVKPLKQEIQDDDYAQICATSDQLISLESALDRLGRRCVPEFEYVRSVAGRLKLFKELSSVWRLFKVRLDFAENLNSKFTLKMDDLGQEKLAWIEEKSRFEIEQKKLVDESKIEKSKLKSALRLCKTMETQSVQARSEQKANELELAEWNQKDAIEKDRRIEGLASDNQKLRLTVHQLKHCLKESVDNFTRTTLLAVEFARSRAAHARRVNQLEINREDQSRLLENSEGTYADHMDRAKTFVLLCCSWPEFGHSVNISAFNDIMYRLLSTNRSFKADIEDVSPQSWFIETPHILMDKVQFTYATAESEAFQISLKLYIIVEGYEQCTQVGFNLIQGLGRTLPLCHDSFVPEVYMMTVDMYVTKLVLLDSIHYGNEIMFAIAICQLWKWVHKEWPGVWSDICPVGGEYDPVIRIRNEFRRSDGFLQYFFDVSSSLPTSPDAEMVEDSLVPSTIPIPSPSWPTGLSIADILKTKFSRGNIQYGQMSLLTETTSKYLVMVAIQNPCSIMLVEKDKFTIARIPSREGLEFILKGEGGCSSHRFIHPDQDMVYQWWHDFMGPFMDFSISNETNSAGMQQYSRIMDVESKRQFANK